VGKKKKIELVCEGGRCISKHRKGMKGKTLEETTEKRTSKLMGITKAFCSGTTRDQTVSTKRNLPGKEKTKGEKKKGRGGRGKTGYYWGKKEKG